MKRSVLIIGLVALSLAMGACNSRNDRQSDTRPQSSGNNQAGVDDGQASSNGNSSAAGGDSKITLSTPSMPDSFVSEQGNLIKKSDLPSGKFSLSRIVVHDVRNFENKKMTSAVDHQLIVAGQFNVNVTSGDRIKGYTDGNLKGIGDGDLFAPNPNVAVNVAKNIDISSERIIPQGEVAWEAIISKNGLVVVAIKEPQSSAPSETDFLGISESSPGIIKHPNYNNIVMSVRLLNEAPIFVIRHSGEDGQYVSYSLYYSRSPGTQTQNKASGSVRQISEVEKCENLKNLNGSWSKLSVNIDKVRRDNSGTWLSLEEARKQNIDMSPEFHISAIELNYFENSRMLKLTSSGFTRIFELVESGNNEVCRLQFDFSKFPENANFVARYYLDLPVSSLNGQSAINGKSHGLSGAFFDGSFVLLK